MKNEKEGKGDRKKEWKRDKGEEGREEGEWNGGLRKRRREKSCPLIIEKKKKKHCKVIGIGL